MVSLSVPIKIEIENAVIEQIAERLKSDRQTLMVLCHGEVCTKATAAKLLSVTPRTICEMIRDGRILDACAGERVDVRSIADYVAQRGTRDHEARMEKKRRRNA